MSELATPKAVLLGFFLIAISIATLPITSSMLIGDASAEEPRSIYYIEDIIEDCDVGGGYVEDEYVYGLSIDC